MTVYKTQAFAKMIGVSTRTLKRWDLSGKFKAYRTPTNQRYYTQEQYIEYCRRSGIPAESIETDVLKADAEGSVLNDNIDSKPSKNNVDNKLSNKTAKQRVVRHE